MKRLWKKGLFLAVVLTIISVQAAMAKQVALNTAKQVARNWMFQKSRVDFDLSSLLAAFTEKVGTDNIYYVLNFPFGGWAIIAADDVAHPIIAYSFNGSYDPQDDRPVQFDAWMDNVKADIQSAISESVAAAPKTSSEWDRLAVGSDAFTAPEVLDFAVPPLLTTTWDQGTYYNQYCPEVAGQTQIDGRVWAGCVATAMAQVMNYHEHPATGFGSHSYDHADYGTQSADFGATTYNWSSMPDSLSTYDSDVAQLIYHCGVSVEMDYGDYYTGSGATTADVADALVDYFKYRESANYLSRSSYTDEDWMAMLRTEIDNSRPLVYRGSGSGGHAFVCDGYNDSDYFHFNWGWSGYYDGYFTLSDLTPGSHNFNSNQAAIFGVEPLEDPSLEYPYSEGFESGIPAEWSTSGPYVSLSSAQTHTGGQSLLLSEEGVTGYYGLNNATLHIDVPPQGAELTFWVKRGYDPGQSSFNQQRAYLMAQFGSTVLHTFYDGDFNDSAWQQMSLDLTTWAGTNVKLFVEQFNSSGSWYEWTYLDDVEIDPHTAPGDIDASDAIDLADVIVGLQVLSGISPASTPDTDADVDGDLKIGMAEVVYVMQKEAGLR